MQYYFLASRLPPLTLGQEPDITWEEYLFLLKSNLTTRDMEWVNVLRRFYDLENIRHLWLEEQQNPFGNYNVATIEEALVSEEGFPNYVYEFLERYHDKAERLRHFPQLTATYFVTERDRAPGFLQDYLQLERQMRLVFLGFRARRMGRDLATELQYEDPDDPLVGQIMAQRDAKSYEPPEGFESLKPLFHHYEEDPLALYQALVAYRFNWIEERLGADTFSRDAILGYTIQLALVLKWLQLDHQKGKRIIDSIMKEAL